MVLNECKFSRLIELWSNRYEIEKYIASKSTYNFTRRAPRNLLLCAFNFAHSLL